MRRSYESHLYAYASLATLLLLLMYSSFSVAVEDSAVALEHSQAVFWNFVIAVIVLVTLIASAALPLAALRQWPGRWRYLAIFPLAALLLWLVVIATGRIYDSGSHRLWPFELFAWAMANMIYMVIIMTAKRKLDKHDAEEPS